MFLTRFAPKSAQVAYRWDARSAWLTGLYMGMSGPFFGVIARRMGASDLEISLLIAAPFIGHLLSMFIAWHMQNQPKMPYVVWLGIIARSLLLLMVFAVTTKIFVAVIILSQIIGCFTLPAYAAVMKDVYPDAVRGQLMGMVRLGLTIASMIGSLSIGHLLEKGLPLYWVMLLAAGTALLIAHELHDNVRRVAVAAGILLGGWLLWHVLREPVSYRYVFPVAGLIGAMGSWMFSHLPSSRASDKAEKPFSLFEGLTTLAHDRRFALYSLAFFTYGFGNLVQVPLIPIFQVDELHITDQWVGILALIASGVSAVFYMVWGRIMDRYSPFYAAIFSFAVWGFSPLVYANAHSIEMLILASVLIGIAGPGVDLTWMNAVMHFTDREGVPRYTAMHTFLIGIRGLLAPLVTAWLLTFLPLRQCFYVSAAIIWTGCILMTLVSVFILIPYHRAKVKAEEDTMAAIGGQAT